MRFWNQIFGSDYHYNRLNKIAEIVTAIAALSRVEFLYYFAAISIILQFIFVSARTLSYIVSSGSHSCTQCLELANGSRLIVSEVFPKIFSRYAPVLDGRVPLREAARILSSPQISAVIVSEKLKPTSNETRYTAVAGFHILSKLLKETIGFSKMLERPCTFAALPITVVNEKESIDTVLKAITESRLGVVLVSRRIGSSEVLTTVELRDFVRIYRMGEQLQENGLKVGDLASSPVLSVRREDTLGRVLQVMIKHRKRKILLYETRSVISDRDILNFLLSSNSHERFKKEPDSLLGVKASELPSSFPPFVDCEMNISDAAKLMNPDDGDCLICDKGLVTFWDMVIKLQYSKDRSNTLLQTPTGTKEYDDLAGKSFQRYSNFKSQVREKVDISPTKSKILDGVRRTIKKHGFIDSQSVPYFAKQLIVDPLYSQDPVRAFRIWGVNSGQKGGRKFTSLDFFGQRMLHESYYVSDWDKFATFLGMKLEVMFRAKNTSPPRQLRLAFTRFMHDFGLHWTECNHVIA